ncbi:MAG: SDR family NAD(P)-dependent oxidoreductase [Candidatus Moranbacteria bacterium]|nr:SDR family NAD(P)-dependent oxidoreductase [Candidatus Moranbacteria bacterium]
MRLENKVAIVTGSASGIGKAIAEEFLNEGAKVMFSDIKEEENLIKEEHEQNAAFTKCDVSDADQVKSLVEETANKFGQVDIMVNNAGIGSMGSVLEESNEDWEKTLKINLFGVFYGVKAAANHMKDHKIKGSIINMSSILGKVGLQNAISYCASKGGVVQVTHASSLDLAPHNIRVNAIAPGFIKTNMTDPALENEDFKNMVESNTPLGHAGEVDDIAKAAVYLASEEAKYVTGEVIYVDGGWRAR